MTRLLYAQRRDKNEREIITALESAGASVFQMDKSTGWDLTVLYHGKDYVAEVKRPGEKLTFREQEVYEIFARQQVKYHILYVTEEALKMIGVI